MGVLDSAYQFEDQLANQWDLTIYSADAMGPLLKYKVEDVNFPFRKLKVERKYSGETVFKDVEEPDLISITIRENVDGSTFQFFEDWKSKFFDDTKRVWKTFEDEIAYSQSLYDIELVFLSSPPLAIPVPYVDINLAKPTFSFLAQNCKPIGIDAITVDYQGNPLKYTVTFQPERVVKNNY